MKRPAPLLVLRLRLMLVLLLLASRPGAAQVTVEYLGHAAFVLTSPAGVRVAIDPFNGTRWLGYYFPEGVEADAVLVTHPHYDHDASYYFGGSVPVFREPGLVRIGDVELLGVEGRHADPYGTDFGQINTIWRVTAGGVSFAHLGDNGPLSEANVRELGRVDVLFVPADGDDHILTSPQIEAIREALDDPVVVPMHYRLAGFHDLPKSLGPIDPWLAKQDGVVRLEGNVARFDEASLRAPERRIVVFEPSPRLEPWSDALVSAWNTLDQARQIVANQPNLSTGAFELIERAYASGEGIAFAFHWAQALLSMDRVEEAIQVLESGLAAASREDWAYRMQSHALLADVYTNQGRSAAALAHYRIVLDGSYRTELLRRAKAAIESAASSSSR